MVIAPKYIWGKINSEKQLTTVGELQFEKGCFDNCFIIDSKGCKYEVISANALKRKFSIFNYKKKYRSVIVRLELSDPKLLNLEKTKEDIANIIVKNKWFGSEIGVSNEKKSKEWIGETSSFKELVSISDLFC